MFDRYELSDILMAADELSEEPGFVAAADAVLAELDSIFAQLPTAEGWLDILRGVPMDQVGRAIVERLRAGGIERLPIKRRLVRRRSADGTSWEYCWAAER